MHWLDITILVALGIGAGFGFWTGLLWQVARVVSLLVATYLGITVNPYVAEWIVEQWPGSNAIVCKVFAFTAVFLIVFVILYLVTHMMHRTIKETELEFVDRIFGAILGMVKMGAIVSAVCAGIAALDIPLSKELISQAVLAPHFARGTEFAVSLVPREYRDRIDEHVRQAREQLGKKAADAALDAMKQ